MQAALCALLELCHTRASWHHVQQLPGLLPKLQHLQQQYQGLGEEDREAQAEEEVANTRLQQLLSQPGMVDMEDENDHIECLPDEGGGSAGQAVQWGSERVSTVIPVRQQQEQREGQVQGQGQGGKEQTLLLM